MRIATTRRWISVWLSWTLAVGVSVGPADAQFRFGGDGVGGPGVGGYGFGGYGFGGHGFGGHGFGGRGFGGRGFGGARRETPPRNEVSNEREPQPTRVWGDEPERPYRPAPPPVYGEREPIRPGHPPYRPWPTPVYGEQEPIKPVRPPYRPQPTPVYGEQEPIKPVRPPYRPWPTPVYGEREPIKPVHPPTPVWTVTAPIRPMPRPFRTVVAPIRPAPTPIQNFAAPIRPTLPPPAQVQPPPVSVGRVFTPPPGETRFRNGEVMVELPNSMSPAAVALILRNHRLTEAKVIDDTLLGTSVRLWRFPDARAVPGVVGELGGETALLSIQPNYIYELQQALAAATPTTPAAPEAVAVRLADLAAAPPTPAPATSSTPAASETAPAPSVPAASEPAPTQYSLAKLNVDDGMVGEPIRVAMIDTAVDESHPDLGGAVEARHNAIEGAGPPRSFDHGTSIAGAIAAHGRLKGVAPNVRILSARAFDLENGKPKGDTASIVDAILWVDKERARVVNMSFAGPQDADLLHRNLAAALAKGMMLVGAAGNAGPKSPPLYPAADESVFAVTATDADDKLYEMANVGAYIAVAAPGVDVLLPAPRGGYALETGTSVSAALVSGVAALVLERRTTTTPAELRRLLMTTATPLGTKEQTDAFGAGLVDARRALSAQPPPATN